MAQSRGPQVFAPPNPYYWQQQQNWGGQVGTRGVGGQQGQPLSPEDFGAPGQPGVQGQPGVGFQGQQPGVGVQGQMGPQQGVGMPEQVPVNLSPQEKEALRGALDILKEGRAALAMGSLEGPVAQRVTAAHAYVSGFLEARGIGELGGYVSTIPPVSTRGSAIDDPEYDQMIDEFDGFLGNDTQTRFPPILPIIQGGILAYKGYKFGKKKKWW
ncbi:hypothetical protein [Archangium lansingense]|uniref:Uncharacterized protein n=1 Tax=Archangium lansingense TaxID=2995310 RepID=A0ABT4ABW8_9BACT|nr:hypothetical protein [Archangium lansinium]MCY1079152.1 hypothetical protein [Archangium lansinium]